MIVPRCHRLRADLSGLCICAQRRARTGSKSVRNLTVFANFPSFPTQGAIRAEKTIPPLLQRVNCWRQKLARDLPRANSCIGRIVSGGSLLSRTQSVLAPRTILIADRP